VHGTVTDELTYELALLPNRPQDDAECLRLELLIVRRLLA